MRKSTIKLNQIVSAEDIKLKFRAQIHKVSNSLKRNTTYQSFTPEKQDQYCTNDECRLPEVGFNRKDLSLVLRYVLSKQQLQVGDRNLLRRILLSHFDQQIVSAGTKKFIHFLRLIEGNGNFKPQSTKQLYFLLKGKGTVHSGPFQYQVHSGTIFGQIEILVADPFDYVQFQSNYLLLALQQKDFETYFKVYYQNKYQTTQAKLTCIKQAYLKQIPDKARFLFLKTIFEKQFAYGQCITKTGEPIKQIYFMNLCLQDGKNININHNCPGLLQTIQSQNVFAQTVKCKERKLTVPCAKISDFQQFVLKPTGSFIEGKSSMLSEQNISCLSLTFNEKKSKPKLINFMRVKKVRLSNIKNKLKTEPTDYSETSFKFLKPEVCQSFCSRRERANKSELAKSKIRYNSVLSRYN